MLRFCDLISHMFRVLGVNVECAPISCHTPLLRDLVATGECFCSLEFKVSS
jgi:hypothetical protein